MITVNLNKARAIAHELRRAAREREFAPLDDIIAKQIPGRDFQEVESERQAIRDADAERQIEIDSATDVAALTGIVEAL